MKITEELLSKYFDIKISNADIIGTTIDTYMRIDDGNCKNELDNAYYHIYHRVDGNKHKIFEGYIDSELKFELLMEMLSIEKL